MAIVAFPRISTSARPTLAAGAMVLVLAGLTAAFVYGAMPAVAGPAGPVPAVTVRVHADIAATLPACTEITEDSPNPACADTDAEPALNPEPTPVDQH
ncbi:hypothetical protein [Nocardia seriolae]|uniref:Uncharacterized protein n=1 Tax=Nocardia seriolae TaxID=37332 RepID=A0A0B8N7E2_9NOCA|nr:hypothetical protein [Nocardia seriolae]APA99692.1 hypothetical protein NS506_05646 [Nocardia seriolae]MTJ64259.1 hypothetical protein [Nocardia seriolae]MTJ72861.1 hypothetical protein [Nocardia seriolae]MTJ89250.1 hypothetical protein [Nocardia seriolae]MTK33228.1 hypothetical protein [Nocardia seriolae]